MSRGDESATMKPTIAMVIATAVLGIAGCVTIPLGNIGGIDDPAVDRLNHEVPLYDSSQLTGDNYLKVGSISASGCDNGFLSHSARDALLAKPRQEAESIGANGITDLTCGHGATNELGGCFSSTICSATALRVVNTTGKD